MPSSKATHSRHNLINIRANRFYLAISKGRIKEASGLIRLKLFLLDDLLQILFPLLSNIFIPVTDNILHLIDTRYERLNELFFTAKFRTGIYSFFDGNKKLFILTVFIIIFLHQHKNIVNIDLDLFYQFDLKDNIIRNIGTFVISSTTIPFIIQVLIFTKIVLKIALREDFHPHKIIEGKEQISHAKNCPKECDKILLILLADNLPVVC